MSACPSGLQVPRKPSKEGAVARCARLRDKTQTTRSPGTAKANRGRRQTFPSERLYRIAPQSPTYRLMPVRCRKTFRRDSERRVTRGTHRHLKARPAGRERSTEMSDYYHSKITRRIACNDVVPGCGFTATAKTEEEL